MAVTLNRIGKYGGGVIIPGDPNPPQAPEDHGTNLQDYMSIAGDRVVIVPNGSSYHMGNLIDVAAMHHIPTGGRFNGWLILVAQTQGGVTVDLSGGSNSPNSHQGATWGTYNATTGFANIPPQTEMRIMFVGFNFINGSQKLMAMQYLKWWYCNASYDHTLSWLPQYQGVGGVFPGTGSRTALGNMQNIFPTPFRCEGIFFNNFASVLQPSNFGWYGCNSFNCGEDAWFLGSLTDSEWQGCQCWASYHNGIDPVDNTGADFFHSDGAQFTQFEARNVMNQCAFGQRPLWIADAGSMGPCTVTDCWAYGAAGPCAVYGKFNGKNLNNLTINGLSTFCGGQFAGFNSPNPTYWPDFDVGLFHDGDGTGSETNISISNVHTHQTINEASLASKGITVGPAGGLATGILKNVKTRPSEVVDHVENPANVWRAAHPYNTYLSYFGLS